MTRTQARLADLADLIRAPAALSVPGDSWAGAAHAPTGAWGMPLASTCLYWSGMALNDWCDRRVDAVERPERPIPSGRVSPGSALAVAVGLGAAGVGLSAAIGGRRALAVSIPLAAMVATYDAVAKDHPAGPLVMASTRGLDVLLGACASPLSAWQPALAMAGHTAALTALSRGEVHGSTRPVAAAVTATTAVVAAGTAWAVGSPARSGCADEAGRGTSTCGTLGWRVSRIAGVGLAAAYAGVVGRAQSRAAVDPTAEHCRSATRTGIGAFPLLQAAWLARRGRFVAAAAVVGAAPAFRAATKRLSPT